MKLRTKSPEEEGIPAIVVARTPQGLNEKVFELGKKGLLPSSVGIIGVDHINTLDHCRAYGANKSIAGYIDKVLRQGKFVWPICFTDEEGHNSTKYNAQFILRR